MALGIAVPLLSASLLVGGPAAAERGGPAAPAPAVASTAAQAQPGDQQPPAPPADPPASQAQVPAQLPAAPPAPPAAPPAAPPPAPPAAGGDPAAGGGSGSGSVKAPVVDTTAGERVVICKYVRKPHVAEVASHVIIVNEQALVGRGFTGTFPWAFSDAQFRSVAIRWAHAGEQARQVSLSDCPRTPTGGGGGGGGSGGSTGGSSFGGDTATFVPSRHLATTAAPVRTAAGELPQTGAPSGLEELLLLSAATLLGGVALRVRALRRAA
ncbi:hypothetical protein GCM10011584_16870 [Nocardioides phosphati]|uniref:Gram-positive cocci surface proteins LPxTG domain-containing protein n=2 Tax=Nocardioides phosphati TaxID=1867775 RepID=A0ABQ2NAF3_9ACTN|nr:hypothetical protein GCM10011584_16870 [Nocardioides phosphati]